MDAMPVHATPATLSRGQQGPTRRRLQGLVTAAAALLLLPGASLAADDARVPSPVPRASQAPAASASPVPADAAPAQPEAEPEPAPAEEPPSGPPPDAIVRFHSRPDLRPPVVTVEAAPAELADHLFITPRFGGGGEGVMIMDGQGRLVWLHRVPGRSAVALKPISHAGQPALMWWEGTIERGLGDGEFVIAGQDYRELARIRTVRRPMDLHDLVITQEGTAYAFAMDVIEIDGQLVDDMLVQEIDIATGRLRWEWRASEHIGTDESVEPAPEEGPWDYLHFNSIDLAPDGDLILSARHTDAVYRVSRETGEILWRLGGLRSDFELPAEAVFRKQHDARWLPDGTISIFDNSTKESDDPEARPRGVVLRLDEAAGSAELVRELLPPHPVDASSQGNLTVDADGSATIGWGSNSLITGHDASGAVTWQATMAPGFTSYRAYRAPWNGRPIDDPLVAVRRDEAGAMTAWVSWNGATAVARWELLAGADAADLESASTAERDGFETGLAVPDDAVVIAVRAFDVDDVLLGSSAVLDVQAALAEPVTVS